MRSAFSHEYSIFLDALIAARKNSEVTQQALAKRLRKPQSFISKYERGERRLDVAEFLGIARELGVDPHKLLRKVDALIARKGSGS